MLSDFLRSKLDITVVKNESLFEARCSLFPTIVGLGSNEKEAIVDLADLIIYRFEEMVTKTLDEILDMPLEKLPAKKHPVITDREERTFSIGVETEKNNFPPLTTEPRMRSGMVTMGFGNTEATRLFKSLSAERVMQDALQGLLSGRLPNQDDKDKGLGGLVIGVPVSFN